MPPHVCAPGWCAAAQDADVAATMAAWSHHLQAADRIFVQTGSADAKSIFSADAVPLSQQASSSGGWLSTAPIEWRFPGAWLPAEHKTCNMRYLLLTCPSCCLARFLNVLLCPATGSASTGAAFAGTCLFWGTFLRGHNEGP